MQFETMWEERFGKLEERFLRFESRISQQVASLEATIHREQKLQMRWMFGVWLVQTGAIVGTLLAVLRNQ